MIPDGLAASIKVGTWNIPPIFDVIERAGGIEHAEMFNVFNMGIGMVLAVDSQNAQKTLETLETVDETGHIIGSIVPEARNGHGRVQFQ